MANKAATIQRRWTEIVRDLSEQNGINPNALLKKMPAFAGNAFDEYSLEFQDVSEIERQVLRAAADTMAELIMIMVSSDVRPYRPQPQEIGAQLIGKSASPLRNN